MKSFIHKFVAAGILICVLIANASAAAQQHLLYVTVNGGIRVYDMDDGYKPVKKIDIAGVQDVRGVCANGTTGKLYLSHSDKLVCVDLNTDTVAWTKTFDAGCDRMSMTPDGKIIYLPSGFWKPTPYWYVVDAANGEVITKVDVHQGSHNTVCGADGSKMYLASLQYNYLTVADTKTHTVIRKIGPFSDVIRPFTVNGSDTLCFVCVNGLLGCEIGDVATGQKLHRVEVKGFEIKPAKRHGCPSHGVGLTPDEKELWITDTGNPYLHIFDMATMPPKQIADVKLSSEPGWVTFSIDGRFAFPSTGDVVDTKKKEVVGGLKDENGKLIESEKLVEVDFADGKPVRAGDQFGVGRKTKKN